MRAGVLSILILISFYPTFSKGAEKRGTVWLDASIERDIEQTMRELHVPGLALGVIDIKNNRTYMKGFGQRDLELGLPVTENTLFMIGSTTKAFTATGLSLLVEEGKLNWNAPVRTVLPEFELQDEVASRLSTAKDLVAHMTGLPRHDLVWYGENHQSRAYFMSLLKYLEPSVTFRQRWQYNNLMYMVAGMMVERLTGQTWEEFTRQRIFQPLNMNQSNFTIEEMTKSADFALPYSLDKNNQNLRTEFHHVGAIGPAGTINSSVVDLVQWLKFNMKHNSVPALLPAKAVDNLHRPISALGVKPSYAEIGYMQYAMGWMMASYRGFNWVWHDGGIDGFTAHVGFMPEEQLGVVVLTNSDSTQAAELVARQVYDSLLGLNKLNWLEREKNRLEKQRQANDDMLKLIPETPAPLIRPVTDYAGKYSHPAYRMVEIIADQEGLRMKFRRSEFPLVHAGHGAFVVHGRFGVGDFVLPATFQINPSGGIESLEMLMEPTLNKPIRFMKVADPLTVASP